MDILIALAFLALIVERLVEYVFSPLFENFEKLAKHKWALMYVALVVGVVSAFTFDLDLLTEVGLEHSVLGVALTGLAVGGGSNLLHELFAGLKR